MTNSTGMESSVEAILEHVSGRYRPAEYPVLAKQLSAWRTSRPLAGLRILDGTPLFTNTLLKHAALLAGGASLTVGISDVIPHDDSLLPLLSSWGIPVVESCRGSGEYDCVLDCDGVHAGLSPRYGFAELTRSGYYAYMGSVRPVILVDDSRVKLIETSLGTGDGFMRGMKALGHNDWRDRTVVIFGFGKVGAGVAFRCFREGARVVAVDVVPRSVPDYVSLLDGRDCAAVCEAVRGAWCVVTATGKHEALRGNGAAAELMRGRQLLAAIGIEDEWGEEVPLSRRLCGGKPVNFVLDEPTRMPYIDATMALSNYAALELAGGSYPQGVSRISGELERFCLETTFADGLIGDEIRAYGI